MALERTLLAWWRTALGCYALGLAIAKALPSRSEGEQVLYVWLGGGFVVAGVVVAGVGLGATREAVRLADMRRPRVRMLVVTGLLLLTGLAALVVVLR